MKEVPVTVICGALGAGKSTILQRILNDPEHGLKIAIIMNDFAEATEVEQVIMQQESVDWVSLPNGCLCCSVKDQAMLALEQLVKRNPLLDHIIIEASGVADPTVLIRRLWVDDALRDQVQLDGVICVFDRIREEPSLRSIQIKQLALADLVIQSKTDLLFESDDLIKDVNPGVGIIKSALDMKLPLHQMLSIREYRSVESDEQAMERLQRAMQTMITDCPVPEASVLCLSWPRAIESLVTFENEWLFPLLWESSLPDYGPLEWELWRGKGLIRDVSHSWGLQIVGEMYNAEKMRFACHEGVKLVLVGRIDSATQAKIRASFSRHLHIKQGSWI